MKNLKSVLVGVDFSEPSNNALREAARIARWDDAKLTAFHVLDEVIVDELSLHAPAIKEELLTEAEKRIDSCLVEILGPDHGAQSHFTIGHPFHAMLGAIKEHSADLLVVGSHGIGSDDVHRVGSLASRCVRKAPVNVLLVRERQEGPFRKVVACVDFSDNAAKAVAQAVHIAQQDHAHLEFIHVNQTIGKLITAASFFTAITPPVAGDYDQRNAERLKDTLDGFVHPIVAEAGGRPFESHVLTGIDSRPAIIDFLQESGADLVVLGTRGRTSIRNLLLGSTAEKVIHDARCSALVIKPDGFTYELD